MRYRKLLVYNKVLGGFRVVVLARVIANLSVHMYRRKFVSGKTRDSFAFKTILVLMCCLFISAFLKLLPFQSTLYKMCSTNIWLVFTKQPVDECFVGTHANLCFVFFLNNLTSIDCAKFLSTYSMSESIFSHSYSFHHFKTVAIVGYLLCVSVPNFGWIENVRMLLQSFSHASATVSVTKLNWVNSWVHHMQADRLR